MTKEMLNLLNKKGTVIVFLMLTIIQSIPIAA